jgi:hypothetical protein
MFSALSYKYSLLYTYTFVDHVSTTTRLVFVTWEYKRDVCRSDPWTVRVMQNTSHEDLLHKQHQLWRPGQWTLQVHVEIFIWWLVPLMEQFMYRVVNNQYLPSYFPFLTLCVSVRMPDEFINRQLTLRVGRTILMYYFHMVRLLWRDSLVYFIVDGSFKCHNYPTRSVIYNCTFVDILKATWRYSYDDWYR